jgi:CHAD domain-containing protein
MATFREIERKVRVDDAFDISPVLDDLGDYRPRRGQAFTMHADYYDTDELTLFRWRITLRRREGGVDQGWHLKLPVPGGAAGDRDEVRLELGDHVPAKLGDIVSPLIGEKPLKEQVVVETLRTPVSIVDQTGRMLAEVVDDRVTVRLPGEPDSCFREIEVEAADADDPDSIACMEFVVECFLSAGGSLGTSSKAAAALGSRASGECDVPEARLPASHVMAIDVIRVTITSSVRALILADVDVRRDAPDSAHRMRVAARQLRAFLHTFDDFFAPEWRHRINDELSWMASELGAIRDTEVLLERLLEHADTLGEEESGRLSEFLSARVGQRLVSARSSALAALRSDRHQYLIEDLTDAACNPSAMPLAYSDYSETMPKRAAASWDEFRNAVRDLDIDSPAVQWHDARILAKRARYAMDALAPLEGKSVKGLAHALAIATGLLGIHQDAHVAQETLRSLASAPSTSGGIGLLLGRLFEYESDEEILDRYRFMDAWPDIKKAARKVEWL